MSKIIENFLLPLFLIFSVLYAFHSFGVVRSFDRAQGERRFSDGGEEIVLHKMYHHMTPDEGYLEKANISLYFSGEPQIQEVRDKKANRDALSLSSSTFFFPNASMSSGECEAMANKINSYTGAYKVTITSRVKPSKGIMITFDYDPQLFMINYEQFDSIGLQKGFVFRLYNKELLHKLEQANNQPILRTLWHTGVLPRIIIDPGHGGLDPGTIAQGIQEKNISLAIGLAVGKLLQQKGYDVLLTRIDDYTVPLDERTTYANNHYADLFISIHANYASNNKAMGIETFCLQSDLFKKSGDRLLDMKQYVSNIIAQRASISYKLAQSIQRNVCDTVSMYHKKSVDRKVKHSVSQVLLGVQVPAVLIEVGFLSHPQESQLLNNSDYQKSIAEGIYKGILTFTSQYFL